jgi:hypothetical protein
MSGNIITVGGNNYPATPHVQGFLDPSGNATPISAANPLPITGGGSGGATTVAVNPGGTGVPLQVDAGGLLKVLCDATVDADLSTIEGLLTSMLADLAAISTATPALGSAAMVGSIPVTLATDDPGVANLTTIAANTSKVAGYAIPTFDYKAFAYSGSNISTIVFKSGGSGGTTLATLTFGYTGANLTSITKT